MNRRILAMLAGMFAFATARAPAQTDCEPPTMRAEVEVGPGALTMADLLPPGACPRFYQAAARIGLGSAPLPGSVRVLAGRDILQRIHSLGEMLAMDASPNEHNARLAWHLPERIVVRRSGTMKSCDDVARFLVAADPAFAKAEVLAPENLNCAAAKGVPSNAQLALTATAWNSSLRRWEFALRCERSGQCVPFLVWERAKSGDPKRLPEYSSRPDLPDAISEHHRPAVARGETVMLTWEQSGIRVILPVTCLEAGGIGQFVRVRFPNSSRTLRAEVVQVGTLRVKS